MKRNIVIIGALLAGVLALRVLGYIDFTLAYRFYELGQSRHSSWDVTPPKPLTRADTDLTHSGRDDRIGKFHIYSSERWNFAWSRWVPLIKAGRSTVTRDYFVTDSGLKVASGHETATVSLSVYGILSTRTYESLITTSDRKRFLEQVEKDMRASAKPPATQTAAKVAAAHL